MPISTESIDDSMKILSQIALKDLYEDEDEFGEVLGWYLQARFGNMNKAKISKIIKSLKDTPLMFNCHGPVQKSSTENTPSSAKSLETLESPKSISDDDEDNVLSPDDHVWVAELLSLASQKNPTAHSGCSHYAEQQAIKAHIRHVLRLPRGTEIPIEAFDYWRESQGTAPSMAGSLFVAGVYRKAIDSMM